MLTTLSRCCEVPPMLDEANIVENPKIVVNRTVLLECPVSGVPVPRVRWLKNGKPLVFSRRVRRLSAGRRVQIVRARVDDTARYTCIAVNDAGRLRRNYDLEVLGITVTITRLVYCIIEVYYRLLRHMGNTYKIYTALNVKTQRQTQPTKH